MNAYKNQLFKALIIIKRMPDDNPNKMKLLEACNHLINYCRKHKKNSTYDVESSGLQSTNPRSTIINFVLSVEMGSIESIDFNEIKNEFDISGEYISDNVKNLLSDLSLLIGRNVIVEDTDQLAETIKNCEIEYNNLDFYNIEEQKNFENRLLDAKYKLMILLLKQNKIQEATAYAKELDADMEMFIYDKFAVRKDKLIKIGREDDAVFLSRFLVYGTPPLSDLKLWEKIVNLEFPYDEYKLPVQEPNVKKQKSFLSKMREVIYTLSPERKKAERRAEELLREEEERDRREEQNTGVIICRIHCDKEDRTKMSQEDVKKMAERLEQIQSARRQTHTRSSSQVVKVIFEEGITDIDFKFPPFHNYYTWSFEMPESLEVIGGFHSSDRVTIKDMDLSKTHLRKIKPHSFSGYYYGKPRDEYAIPLTIERLVLPLSLIEDKIGQNAFESCLIKRLIIPQKLEEFFMGENGVFEARYRHIVSELSGMNGTIKPDSIEYTEELIKKRQEAIESVSEIRVQSIAKDIEEIRLQRADGGD